MIRYFFIGLFGNLFLPSSIGGDVIKIYGLCKDSSQKPKVVASVLLDRLSGFGGMMVLALVSFVLGFKMINDFSLLISICILAIIVIGLATILFNEKVYSFCCQIFNKFPKFKNALMNMHYDIALLKGNRLAVVQAVLVSSLAQIVLAVTFFIVAKALLQDIAFIYFLIFVPLICVASSLPSIGGLGVREAGAAYLFAKVGVDSGIAVSISLINFFYMVLVGLLGGAIYVLTLSSGRIQHHQTNELGRQKA